MRKEKRIRSWFLAIFGLPFFAVGVYFTYSTLVSVFDGLQMASWHQTQGILLSAELSQHQSDRSTTYQAKARYRYQVSGVDYYSERVAIHGGSDNIGDFQQQLGRQLEKRFHEEDLVPVYYDPSEPNRAVLNRDIRWGMIGFNMIFITLFGGVGLGLILFGLRGKRVIDTPEAVYKPWLARPEWAENRILSGARSGMLLLWGFTSFWNILSIPAAISLPEVWRNEGGLALLILLFPLIGLGLLAWTVKKTLEWRRFGYTPLTMDPYPGSIGGDVGGDVHIDLPYVSDLLCEVTLSSLYSSVTGSGKSRSRSETVNWQDSGYAQVRPSAKGMRLSFRFSVPEGLNPSEEETGNFNFWRLNIRLKLPGSDLDRSFTIPVYATAEKSRFHYLDSAKESAKETPSGMTELSAEMVMPLRRNGMVQEVYYPMLRQPVLSAFFTVFGLVFAVTGVILWGKAAEEGGELYFMGGLFTLLGSMVVLAGLYSALNSLYVAWDGKQVVTIRRLLGIKIRWHSAGYDELRGIEFKKASTTIQLGNKHQIQYQVVAQSGTGKIVLAENLDSHSKATLVADYFSEQFNLPEPLEKTE